MYYISKDLTLSCAHYIRGHRGGCEKTHGHNYRLRITLRAEKLNDMGMIMDFKDLEKSMKEIFQPYDHAMLNEVPPFDEQNPTAENMARYFYERLSTYMKHSGAVVDRVEIFENDSSSATYMNVGNGDGGSAP